MLPLFQVDNSGAGTGSQVLQLWAPAARSTFAVVDQVPPSLGNQRQSALTAPAEVAGQLTGFKATNLYCYLAVPQQIYAHPLKNCV